MFTIRDLALADCKLLLPTVREDERGSFTKFFHREWYARHELSFAPAEVYVSQSKHNVLRGMHFQTPPHDHAKVVFCLEGEVLDVLVDLRPQSPTYGQHTMERLSSDKGEMAFIPSGMAHGFYVPGASATMCYLVSREYAPAHDTGVRWDSCGITWPTDTPLISPRDGGFETLADYQSQPISFPSLKFGN